MEFADKPISKPELTSISESPRRRFEIAVALISLALDEYINSTYPLAPKEVKYRMISEIIEERKKITDTLPDIPQGDAT
jgi:hypothetical protein